MLKLDAAALRGWFANPFGTNCTQGRNHDIEQPVNGFAVEDGVGYLVGAGYDMKFGNNLIAGAEVLYHEFDDDALNVEVTTLRLRVGYSF